MNICKLSGKTLLDEAKNGFAVLKSNRGNGYSVSPEDIL